MNLIINYIKYLNMFISICLVDVTINDMTLYTLILYSYVGIFKAYITLEVHGFYKV